MRNVFRHSEIQELKLSQRSELSLGKARQAANSVYRKTVSM